jgi:hypothetical protein
MSTRKSTMLTLQFVSLSLVLVATAGVAAGSCPSLAMTSPPRESFETLEWRYSGSYNTTDIAAGANAWNAQESFITIQAGGYDDVDISDDTTAQSDLADILIYTFGNYPEGNHVTFIRAHRVPAYVSTIPGTIPPT